MNWAQAGPGGVWLRIHVTPRAEEEAIQGLHGDALKVRLRAPPVDNKANEALVRLLAGRLELPRHRIQLGSGRNSRSKRVFVVGLDVKAVVRRLVAGAAGWA